MSTPKIHGVEGKRNPKTFHEEVYHDNDRILDLTPLVILHSLIYGLRPFSNSLFIEKLDNMNDLRE